jgi:hypothetical protein
VLRNEKSKLFDIKLWHYEQNIIHLKQSIEKLCLSQIRLFGLLKNANIDINSFSKAAADITAAKRIAKQLWKTITSSCYSQDDAYLIMAHYYATIEENFEVAERIISM